MGIRLYDPDALLLSQLRELQVTCGESEVTVRLRNHRRTGKREPQAGFLAATRGVLLQHILGGVAGHKVIVDLSIKCTKKVLAIHVAVETRACPEVHVSLRFVIEQDSISVWNSRGLPVAVQRIGIVLDEKRNGVVEWFGPVQRAGLGTGRDDPQESVPVWWRCVVRIPPTVFVIVVVEECKCPFVQSEVLAALLSGSKVVCVRRVCLEVGHRLSAGRHIDQTLRRVRTDETVFPEALNRERLKQHVETYRA